MTSIRFGRSASVVAALLLTASAAWGQAANGNGLIAEHYPDANFTAPATVVTPNTAVNNAFGDGTGDPGTATDVFSSRYRGEIEGPVAGSNSVTFELQSDDQARLYLNGELIINNTGVNTQQASRTLEGGVRYRIMVEHVDTGGGANIHLRWAHPGNLGVQAPIPTFHMFSPTVVPATPTITGNGGSTPVLVTLTTTTPGAEIWYTLNGNDPGLTVPETVAGATLYTGPFDVNELGRVRARAHIAGVTSELLTSNLFTPELASIPSFTPPVTGSLYYRYYELAATPAVIPALEPLIPVERGSTPVPSIAPRNRDVDYALKFNGYVNILTGGTWTFNMSSDDGSRLWIGSVLVVDNDGNHGEPAPGGTTNNLGTIRLQAGWHPLTIEFYQGNGGHGLSLRWTGPGVTADEIVPNVRFGRDQITDTPTAAPNAAPNEFNTATHPITLTSAGAVIYYTLDGSVPDPRNCTGFGNSPLPLTLTTTTRVRAMAVLSGSLPGDYLDVAYTRTNFGPNLLSAVPMGADNKVELNFDRAVTDPSASTAANYALDNGASVVSAALQPRNADLRLWMKFDETMGTTAADSSGAGNDGTYVNSPVPDTTNFAPIPGNTTSLSFQQADSDYVTVPHDPSLDFGHRGFTVTFWIRPGDSVIRRVISKWDEGNTRGWFINVHSGTGTTADTNNIRFNVDDGPTSDTGNVSTDVALSNSEMQHIACRYDRVTGRVQVFKNGQPFGTDTAGPFLGSVDNSAPLLIGRLENFPLTTTNGNHLHGSLDDLRIYAVALTNAEIAALAAGAADPSTRVVLTTSALTADTTTYTVTHSNIQDVAGNSGFGQSASFIYRTGSLAHEMYTGIGTGNAVTDLTRHANFPSNPTSTGLITTAEFSQTGGTSPGTEAFGRRVRGYFIAPQDGNYVFSLASDDNGALFLSTDEDPARKRRVAWVLNSTGFRDHADADVIQSGPNAAGETNNLASTITLVANQRYYMEAYVKEGGGGDHFAIAAKIDDAAPIPGNNPASGTHVSLPQTGLLSAPVAFATLAPYIEAPAMTNIVHDRAVRVGQSTTFTFTTYSTGATYQWFKGTAPAVAIGGQTSRSLTLNNIQESDAGVYTLVGTGPGGSVTSPPITLTVITPPTPTVTAITPTAGPSHGAQSVRVTGTNLEFGTAQLELGGSVATNTWWSGTGTFMTALTSGHAAGTVDTLVRVDQVSGSLASSYGYDIPLVGSVSPALGDDDGTTLVTITGSRFLPGPTIVRFNGVQAVPGSVSVAADGRSLTCLAPAQAATPGAISVSVESAAGLGTLPNAFRYYDDATIGTMTPVNGPVGGGPPPGSLTITITGGNFVVDNTFVTFGAAAEVSASVNVAGDQLTVSPPPAVGGVPGTVAVSVRTPSGSVAAGSYTYHALPTLTMLSQSSGFDQGMQVITLTGTNFVDGLTDVSFGTTTVAAFNVTAGGASVTTPGGTNTVNVTVTTPGGVTTPPLTYTYVPDPVVTSLLNLDDPTFLNNGRSTLGNNVRISGSNFVAPVGVTFNGVPAGSINLVDANTIECVSPNGPAGARTVTVTTPGGSDDGTWNYHDQPTITAVSGSPGSTQGGQTVNITGTNFAAGFTQVTFGGANATGENAGVSPMTAVTPAHSAGQVNVVVVTPGGSATLTNGFTYAGPFINSVNPSVGSVNGGQSVIIQGSGFTGATEVRFGTNVATPMSVDNDGQITATAPGGTVGVVSVTVFTPSGNFVFNNAYTYVGSPTISSVTPNQGPTGGLQPVRIIGDNFAPGNTEVRIDGNLVNDLTFTGTTQLDFTTPGGVAGATTVTVVTFGSAPGASAPYTYHAPPSLSGIVPNRGPLNGNQTVTVTGGGFVDGFTQVLFGTNAVSPTSFTPTSITVQSPPGAAAGNVNVVVRTFNSLPSSSSALTYTYVNQATAVDLELSMSVDDPFPTAGQNVTFTLNLRNIGAVNATNVQVSNPLPAGLTFVSATPSAGTYSSTTGVWNVGTLNSNPTPISLAIVATVSGSVNVLNIAEVSTVTEEDVDSVPNNGSASEDDRATASVDAGLVILTPDNLPDGTERAFYSATVAAGGGSPPYTWALTTPPATFPFNLDPATGRISGFAPAVNAAADYTFTLQVIDSSSTPQTSSRSYTVTINPENAGPPAVNSVADIPDAVVGQPFFYTFAATGGAPPYTWDVAVGSLPAGLTLNRFTGELAGVPTAAATGATFSVRATPSTGAASPNQAVIFDILASPITITPATLPNGTVGALYSQVLEVSGGVGPFNWSTTGILPSNVALASTTGRQVILSGTPAAAATSNFTVTVTDAGQTGVTSPRAYTVTIAASGGPLAITTPSTIPSATLGRAYSMTLSGEGGNPPYFWSLPAGSALPSGLTLNGGSGVISGTPTTAGVFSFSVQQQQFGGGATPDVVDITITVAPPPTLTTPLSLPAGSQGSGYFAQLSFAGGVAPLTWTLTSGTLPTGISLNGLAGVLSGTPTTNGDFSFRLTATDANGASVFGDFTLSIADPSAITIVSTSLPRGQVNVPYSAAVSAAGGTTPYTFALTEALPAGMSFDTSTGAISGTPSATASVSLTFTVTGGATSAPRVLTLNIDGPLAITTISLPGAGLSSPYASTLVSTGGVGGLVWTLSSGALPGGLALSPSGVISGTVSATATTSNFQVRVTDSLGRASSRSFTLTVSATPPPSGGGSGGGGGCGGTIGLRMLPWGALAGLAALLALGGRRRNR